MMFKNSNAIKNSYSLIKKTLGGGFYLYIGLTLLSALLETFGALYILDHIQEIYKIKGDLIYQKESLIEIIILRKTT